MGEADNQSSKQKANKMKFCILGLGVIGTTYGYVFQKAGHETAHWIRENKRDCAPDQLSVHMLDGRHLQKGEEKEDTYQVALARKNTDYDFILVSVANGGIKSAIETVAANQLRGSILLLCNFWNNRAEIDSMIGDRPYMICFPTAGGQMKHRVLDCALFDHVMLEHREKTNISNYDSFIQLLESADLKAEIPYDMVEWIWLHMAINAGVTSTAAQSGCLDDPHRLALDLMNDSHALAEAVRTIRETVKVAASRGMDLKKYRNEILPYQLPAPIAGAVMFISQRRKKI